MTNLNMGGLVDSVEPGYYMPMDGWLSAECYLYVKNFHNQSKFDKSSDKK